jgi:hypothetical protein
VSAAKLENDAEKYNTRLKYQNLTAEQIQIALDKLAVMGRIKGIKTRFAEAKAQIAEMIARAKANAAQTHSIMLDDFEYRSTKAQIRVKKAYNIALIKTTIASIAADIATKGFITTLMSSPLIPIALAFMAIGAAFIFIRKGISDNEKGVTSLAGGMVTFGKSILDILKLIMGLFVRLNTMILKLVFGGPLLALRVTFKAINIAIQGFSLFLKFLGGVINFVTAGIAKLGNNIKKMVLEFIESIPLLNDFKKGIEGIGEAMA